MIAVNSLADLHTGQNHSNEGAISSTEALALARVVGDRVGEGHALLHLGNLARRDGELERSRTLLDEALSIARSLDDRFLIWRSLHNVGSTLTGLGDYDHAQQTLEECLAVARSMGHVWGTANTLRNLGQLALQEGKRDRATALIEESLPLLARMGDPRTTRQALWNLGMIALADQDPRRASVRFADSLRLTLKSSARREAPRCVDGLVAASMAIDPSAERSTGAARLLGASATMRETYGPASMREEQELCDQAQAATIAKLAEHAYDAAQAEGRSLSFDRATELALTLAAELQATDL